jgi:hypothetical protein
VGLCGLWRPHLPDRWHDLSGHAHTAAILVLYDLLFVMTRHGVSGKELQRQLGVTYKTAWRMGHKIREQLDKGEVKQSLIRHVEIDEAHVGGKRPGKRGRGAAGRTIVTGFKEHSERLVPEIIPNINWQR